MKRDYILMAVAPTGFILIVSCLKFAFTTTSLTPALNTFIRQYYAFVGLICSLIYLLIIFRLRIVKSQVFKVLMVLIVILLTVKFGFDSMFYRNYKQEILRDFGHNYYLVKTSNSGFIFCATSYSIKKINTLLSKNIVVIGCNQYQIHAEEDKLKVIIINKPLTKIQKVTFDTIMVDLK